MKIEINSNDKELEKVNDVKILGVNFNQHLSWSTHVNYVTKCCYATIKSLNNFKRTADFNLRKTLAQSLILSKLDYCNVLFQDAPKYLLKRLQKVQNAAASFVLCRHASENDVFSLGWLPVEERIASSLAKLAYKALHDPSWPAYLKLSTVVPRGRFLRSELSTQGNIDINTGSPGTFAICAGNSFNMLPTNIKEIDDFKAFKRKCSIYYFDRAIARILSQN